MKDSVKKVEEFLKQPLDTIIEYCNALANNPTPENVEALKSFLLVKDSHFIRKFIIPRYIARLFVYLGKQGLEVLEEVVRQQGSVIYTNAILCTIHAASQGKLLDIPEIDKDRDVVMKPEITDETSRFARETLINIVTESFSDEELFFHFNEFVHIDSLNVAFEKGINKSLFEIISKSIIKLNERILREFESLINAHRNEETYQEFLKNNPSLIDPLAFDVFNKVRLGIEHTTDFVIRRLDDEYILVEIEKPSSKIFTQQNDFTAVFTHAMGQVLDFQEWVEGNIAYAEKLLPHISSPQGLLIIGMKRDLSPEQVKKLKRFNINTRGRLSVITFDELLEQGRKYLENLYAK